jgi:hypothetical protein
MGAWWWWKAALARSEPKVLRSGSPALDHPITRKSGARWGPRHKNGRVSPSLRMTRRFSNPEAGHAPSLRGGFKHPDLGFFFRQCFALFVEAGIVGAVVLLETFEAGERVPAIPQ